MKILLMGPQGCGKGTQGELLSKYLGIPLISVGQFLREIPDSNPLARKIKQQMNEGLLVEQDLVAHLLKDLVKQPEYSKGYIFDGWARIKEDLTYFNPGFDAVIYIDISEKTSYERLATRLTCSQCGRVYNIKTMPPLKKGICDVCGGKLIQRDDDTREAIKKRLEIFHDETKEVIEYFSQENKLIKVSGEGTPEEVFEIIKTELKQFLPISKS